MDSISSKQAAGLFISAIGTASKLHPDQPVAVVIDGLDETDRNQLKDTATIFSYLFDGLPNTVTPNRTEDDIRHPFARHMNHAHVKHVHLDTGSPSSIRDVAFFLSRTEDDIRHPFARHMNHAHVKHVHLDTGSPSSIRDVAFFLSRTEDDIRHPFARHMNHAHVKHVHLDTGFPSSIRDVAFFLRKRGSQIVEDNDLNWTEWPGEERMDLLAIRASGLFIWAVTVSRFLQEQIEASGTECLNDVLDLLNAEALGDINALYGLILRQTYRGQTHSSWEFEKFRAIVGAIVITPRTAEPQRSGVFTQSKEDVDKLRTILVAGAEAIDRKTLPRLHKSFFEYIVSDEVDERFRVMVDAAERDVAVQCLCRLADAEGHAYAPKSLLSGAFRYALRFWSSHLYPVGGTSTGAVILDVPSLTWPDFHDLIKRAPHTAHSLLFNVALSRDRSQAIIHYDDQSRRWDLSDGAEVDILEGHKDPVLSVAKTAAILRGHRKAVRCVKYSPAGDRLASSSDDWTVLVWNVVTYQRLSVLEGHTGPVRSIMFSPNGKELVSGGVDNTVRYWKLLGAADAVGRHSRLFGHLNSVSTVAYSFDGQDIISGSGGNTLLYWDIPQQRPGEVLPPTLPAGDFIQLSPSGKHVAQVCGSQGD
ncbi:hypothetical protein H0H87_008431 [Tephrocybe sp. NHM501043]|nr:hypothetical protein H0H87_008431 [Tephrocybe sp. NHM501043]